MKKRKWSEDHDSENHERWLVSYADFITLLFAFFIVLYATSERNTQKTQEFQKSLKKFLVKVSGSLGGEGTILNEGEKHNTPIAPPIRTFKTASNEANEVVDKLEKFVEENISEEKRKSYILDISHDVYGVRLSLDGSKIFAENSILLETESLKIVDMIIFLLKDLGNKIIVENHVDRTSKRPKPFDNDWKLSAARSAQIVDYMVRKHGLNSQNLAALGLGSEQPIYPNDDIKLRSKNQRLEFLILTEESPF
ncbi:MAG: flagellar motor protein MotB [Bdellovibrionales bacterium]|nr:flagellar motor protein MotB [Bdellovibrionales bacterium]